MIELEGMQLARATGLILAEELVQLTVARS
jgi:hypothetical protein